MNGETNRVYFNGLAQEWDSRVFHDRQKIEMIVRSSGIERGDAVLDIGSGTGVMLPFLRDAVGDTGRLIALDVSENMIAIARERNGCIANEYCTIDFFDYPAKAVFDEIMAYSCFPHFGDHGRFFGKARALLNPGGRLVVAHSESKETINGIHSGDDVMHVSQPLPPVRVLTDLATQYGFSIIIEEDAESHYLFVIEKDV